MDQRDEPIVVETEHHRITGYLRLPSDGYRSRMTDYLNSGERQFIALTDVVIEPLSGPMRQERRDFIALSLRHIVLAMPSADADERAGGAPPEDLRPA